MLTLRVVHIGIGNRLSDGILVIVRVDRRVGVDQGLSDGGVVRIFQIYRHVC